MGALQLPALSLLLVQLALILVALPASLALYRQAHILRARIRYSGITAVEGPEVGAVAPRALARFGDDQELLFLVEACPSTPDVLDHLVRLQPHASPVLVVLPRRTGDQTLGSVVQQIRETVRSLTDHGTVITDHNAARLADALGITSGPLYLRLHGGLVAAKQYVTRGDDLIALLGWRDATADRRMTPQRYVPVREIDQEEVAGWPVTTSRP